MEEGLAQASPPLRAYAHERSLITYLQNFGSAVLPGPIATTTRPSFRIRFTPPIIFH